MSGACLLGSALLLIGLSLRAAPSAPFAATQAPTGIRSTSAVLRGMATPNGLPSVAWFEWGTSHTVTRTTAAVDVGAGTGVVPVGAGISNLAAREAYRCRLVVSNSLGVVEGSEQQFLTGGKIIGWGWNWDHQLEVPTGLTNVVMVDGGQFHSLALRDDGIPVVWGAMVWGENCREALVVPEDLGPVQAVAAGANGNIALLPDGTVRGWGCEPWIWTEGPAGLSNVVTIAAGDRHGLALHADGTVAGWGEGPVGTTGIPVGLSNVVAIAAGAHHSLALRNDGTVVSWGANWAGQADVPIGLTQVIGIAAGGYHNLALRQDGTVVAWGSTTFGQTTVPTGLSDVVAIAAGANHSLALRADGRVVAWGGNLTGVADAPDSATNVVTCAAGDSHSLAVGRLNTAPVVVPQVVRMESRSDLVITLEGTDLNGDLLRFRVLSLPAVGRLHQFETGSLGPAILAAETEVTDAGRRVVFVPEPEGYGDPYAGFDFVANDGEADSAAARITVRLPGEPFATTLAAAVIDGSSWMLNGLATPNGFPTTAWFEWGAIRRNSRTTTPVDLGSGSEVIHIRAGITNLTAGRTYRACLVTSNEVGVTRGADQWFAVGNRVVAWGANGFGQTNVPAGLTDVVAVAGGFGHNLAVQSRGTAIAWGNNESGQANVPPDLTGLVAVTGGGLHSLALRLDGTVAGFGYDGYGQSSPPAGLSHAVAIATGNSHNLAVRSDGTVVAWGANDSFQTNVPAGLTHAVGVAAGRSHSLALRDDGRVVAWGTNLSGQLDVPPALREVVAVAAGDGHNLALRRDRTVVAWGNNFSGQTSVPATLSGVVAITAGDQHSLALREDGTVALWGSIWDGQTYVPATVPPGLSNVVAVAAGAMHSLALCVDTGLVNAAPEASAQWVTGPANQDLTPRLSGSDPDGDPIRFRVTSLPLRGTLYQYVAGARGSAILVPDTGVSDPSGRIFFVPEAGSEGDPDASFRFVANDGGLDSAPATVTVRIDSRPFVFTQTPTPVRDTSAMLNGMVTPNGLASIAWYEWGATTNYGQTTAPNPTGEGTQVIRVSASISNLVMRHTYHCRLVASNAAGVTRGADRRFVTGGRALGWGDNLYGTTNVPSALSNLVQIAVGRDRRVLGLRTDGSVVAWGDNSNGETDLPTGLSNVTGIARGLLQSLAVRADGTVAAWHCCGWVVAEPPELHEIVAVAAGEYHGLALRRDGIVLAWGNNERNQTDVPEGLSNVVAITTLGYHNLALRDNGRVIAWGERSYGKTDVPENLDQVVEVSVGWDHSLALRADGTVVAWGNNDFGQTGTPTDLSGVVSIAAGWFHNLALQADGSVRAWGANYSGQTNGPLHLRNVVSIAPSADSSLVLLDPRPEVTALSAPDAEGLFFRQTGLMGQRVRLWNSSPWTSPAARVLIQGLSSGMGVYNASGTNDLGQPYVQYSQPLEPGASIDLIIEYYSPTRAVPQVDLVGEWSLPADPLDPVGTAQQITRNLPMADGSYLIDFRTLADRTYYLQYSADLSTWSTAFPPVVGSGSGMQWVDNGPPKTKSHPRTQTNRFYRVLLAP